MSIKSLALYIDNLSSISILTGTFKLYKLIKALSIADVIADQQNDLQSQQDTVPPQTEHHPRPVLAPVVADLSGKRPRDDPSA